MTIDQTKKLVTNYADVIWSKGNVDRIGEFLADNYVEHNPFGEFRGLDELRGFIMLNRRAFPDMNVSVDLVVAQETSVADYYTITGTHKESFGGIDATNKKVTVTGCYVARVENGKLTEAWNQFDVMAMMTQLEVFTPSEIIGDMEELRGMGGSGSRH